MQGCKYGSVMWCGNKAVDTDILRLCLIALNIQITFHKILPNILLGEKQENLRVLMI